MQNRQPARNRLEIIISLVFAGCTAFQSACALAQHRPGGQPATNATVRKGAEVVVTLIGGSRRGELVSVGADGLVIAMEGRLDGPWSQDPGTDRLTLSLPDIKSVRVIKKMRKSSAGLIGALAGIPLGVGAAKVSGVEADDMEDAIGKGSLFLLGGALIGAAVTILLADPLASDETYIIDGQSEGNLEKILIQLKKWARTPSGTSGPT
jgi:hypothetical protein